MKLANGLVALLLLESAVGRVLANKPQYRKGEPSHTQEKTKGGETEDVMLEASSFARPREGIANLSRDKSLKQEKTNVEEKPDKLTVQKFKTTHPFEDVYYRAESSGNDTLSTKNYHTGYDYCPRKSSIKWSSEGINIFDASRANNKIGDPRPTPGICVGNGFVLETVDGALRIFSAKKGKPLSPTVSLNKLYGLPPVPSFENRSMGLIVVQDTACHFDPVSECWFHVGIAVALDSNIERNGTTYITLAASTTEDPLGSWETYLIPGENDGSSGTPDHQCPSGTCSPSRARVGVDENGVFITTNEFDSEDFGALGFQGAQIYAVSKAAFGNGGADMIDLFLFDTANPAWKPISFLPIGAISLFPALSAGDQFSKENDGTNFFVSATAVVDLLILGMPISNTLILWSLTNTKSLNSANARDELKLSFEIISTQNHSVPLPVGYAAKQKSIRPLGVSLGSVDPGSMEAGEGVLTDARYANGKVWTVFPTGNGAPFQTGVAWFIIDPVAATVSNEGIIPFDNDHGESRTFPAVAVTPSGCGVIGFTRVGDDLYPSQGYAHIDVKYGTGEVMMIKEGNGPHDSPLVYSDDPARSVPFGAVGAAAVDGEEIYLANQYTESSCSVAQYNRDKTCGGTRVNRSNWSTRVTKLKMKW